ncbi:MAG: MGMT family protein [Hadesarchaea archaeon]|nr:MGMT family protein [Hadesarchaea archaeon]
MSEFQSRVLKLVSMVPRGKVTTYKELALAIGRPRACRAVGNALARNPNPVIIPCHRVVRSDGKIGGYKFGERKKAKLLLMEGVMIKNGKVDPQNFLTKLPSPVRHCRGN